MDFLINPNVTYLFLVAGSILAILALFSPGTGLLELGALSLIALAGYGIYNQPINLWALILLVVGIFPALLALRRTGRYLYLVISLLALVIGSAYLFRSPVWWQPAVHPLLALIVSALSFGFLWVIAHKGMEALQRRPNFSLQDLIGSVGETTTAVYDEGSVYVNGEQWSARSTQPIAPERQVRVIGRKGFILEVEEVPSTRA